MRRFGAALTVFLVMTNIVRHTLAEVFDECEGIENGSFVASQQSCQGYIYCDGDDSIAGECEDGEYFDGESCDAAENVFCPLDVPQPEYPDYPEEPEEPEPEPVKSTTTSKATTSATTPTPATAASTFEPATGALVVHDRCPDTDDPNQIVLMSNMQSCSDYYLCYHGNALAMHCTDHLHFNMHTGKCDFPENVQCMIDRPQANKCLPHVTDFFPHTDKCNYFYYCIKGFLTVQQCPFYYGWDIERRSCVQMSQAKCYEGAKKN